MTTNSGNPEVTPAPAIHNLPATQGNGVLAIAGQLEASAQFIIEGFIGQVLIAFGGINIAGFTPFALLSALGQALVAQANAAYTNAGTAQTTADTANANNQNLVDYILTALGGSSVTDMPMHLVQSALAELVSATQTAGQSAAEAWSLASAAIGQIDAAINSIALPIYTDTAAAIEAGASAIGGLVGTAVNAEVTAIGWVLGFLNGATGQANTSATVSQASAAAAALAEAQAAAAIAIARQQAAADGATNGGLFSDDDFERVATADINGSGGSGFWAETTSASKAADGYYAIVDGHTASFVAGAGGGAGSQLEVFRRTKTDDAQTQTLYQKVGVIIGGFIGNGSSFGVAPSVTRIRSRLNAAETQEVFCNITGDGFAQFGYRNGSTTDVLVGTTQGIGLASPGTAFYLVAGTTGGVRQFQLLKGLFSVVHTWNDSSALSAAVQGTNNGWGWGGYSGGASLPADVGIVTIADNTPATVLGTGFRVYRQNVAAGATCTAGAAFPAGTFDVVDEQSTSAPFNLTAGTFTVPQAGWWSFTLGATNSTTLTGFSVWVSTLIVNGVAKEPGDEIASTSQRRATGKHQLYLQKGDVVVPGLDGSSAALFPIGDAAGFNTHFSGVLTSGAAG